MNRNDPRPLTRPTGLILVALLTTGLLAMPASANPDPQCIFRTGLPDGDSVAGFYLDPDTSDTTVGAGYNYQEVTGMNPPDGTKGEQGLTLLLDGCQDDLIECIEDRDHPCVPQI